MRCPFCNTENIPGADYCVSCGHDLLGFDRDLQTEKDFRTGFARSILETTVADLGLEEAIMLPVTATAREAVNHLSKVDEERGALLVTDANGKMVGIFTQRDILITCAHRPEELDSIKLQDIMSTDPVTVDDSDTLALVFNRMYYGGLRHIPVQMVGGKWAIFCIAELLRHFWENVRKARQNGEPEE